MNERHEYVSELVGEVAPDVWVRLSGNGSLRMNIDTDVQCYGPFDPHGNPHLYDEVREAQNWVEYFVRSTINRLIDKDLLNAPEVAESNISTCSECGHSWWDHYRGDGCYGNVDAEGNKRCVCQLPGPERKALKGGGVG